MYGGYFQDMKGAWSASPGTTAPVVNAPTLLAVQPLLTQANTPIQAAPQQPQATIPKQDTSSKFSLKFFIFFSFRELLWTCDYFYHPRGI